MKNLKKTAAVLTAAAMMMSMSIGMSAYAANPIISAGGFDTAEVKGTYNSGSGGGTVYKVDVEWGGMQFTYNAGNSDTWDPVTHTYSGSSAGSWSVSNGSSNNIKVTNHSDAAITATVSFQAAAGFLGVEAEYSNSTMSLANAAIVSENNPDGAPSDNTTVMLKGDPGSFSDEQTIGTLTVTIADSNTQ